MDYHGIDGFLESINYSLEKDGSISRELILEMLDLIHDLKNQLDQEKIRNKDLNILPDPVLIETIDQARNLPNGHYWIYPDDGTLIWLNAGRFNQTWLVEGYEDSSDWTNETVVGSWIIGPIPRIPVPERKNNERP